MKIGKSDTYLYQSRLEAINRTVEFTQAHAGEVPSLPGAAPALAPISSCDAKTTTWVVKWRLPCPIHRCAFSVFSPHNTHL